MAPLGGAARMQGPRRPGSVSVYPATPWLPESTAVPVAGREVFRWSFAAGLALTRYRPAATFRLRQQRANRTRTTPSTRGASLSRWPLFCFPADLRVQGQWLVDVVAIRRAVLV